jgi:hypothetical protein
MALPPRSTSIQTQISIMVNNAGFSLLHAHGQRQHYATSLSYSQSSVSSLSKYVQRVKPITTYIPKIWTGSKNILSWSAYAHVSIIRSWAPRNYAVIWIILCLLLGHRNPGLLILDWIEVSTSTCPSSQRNVGRSLLTSVVHPGALNHYCDA